VFSDNLFYQAEQLVDCKFVIPYNGVRTHETWNSAAQATSVLFATGSRKRQNDNKSSAVAEMGDHLDTTALQPHLTFSQPSVSPRPFKKPE